jgi:parallel beta-helix repeat protein
LTKNWAFGQETLIKTLLPQKQPSIRQGFSVKKKTLLTVVFISVLLLSTVAGSLFVKPAMAETVIVPDDYATIQGVISAANEGDTIFVKKGTYEGPKDQTLVINKSLSLIGEDAANTKINLHPLWIEAWFFTYPSYYDTPMEILANDIKISGFTITSDGGRIFTTGNRTQIIGNIIKTGLRVEGGSHVTIAENTLTGVECYGSYCRIASNVFEAGGIGVGGSYNVIYGNTVTNAGSRASSINLRGNDNIIFNNTIKNSFHGVSIYDSGSNNFVYSNRITHNIYGIVITGGNNNTFYANDLVNNTCGAEIGYLEPPATNCTLYHNNFIGSSQQVSTRAHRTYIPGVWSEPFYLTGFFDNGKEGNYWSDYTGTDSDGDGIGDTPYVIDADRQDNYPLMASFDIYSVSVFLICPENEMYATASVPLNFTVYKPTSWIGYSLDGHDNVTITGNTTLTQLSNGLHKVTVYANDTFGNTGASKTIYFNITEPFPTILVIALIASVASVGIIGVVLLVYFKKLKKRNH